MKKIKKILLILLCITLSIPILLTELNADTQPGVYIVTATTLNLRAEATSSSSIVGALYYGEQITVTKISGNWAYTTHNGKSGWCSLSYLLAQSGIQHSISEAGLDLIKGFEGFSKYAFWDYSQWTIGYGTACEEGAYPNGITEKEAEELLRSAIVRYELYLNTFLSNNDVTVNQNQYDALVSFTYNLGNIWSKNFTLKTYLIEGASNYSDKEIIAAFGEFVTAGGAVVPGLVQRRNAEAAYFLFGTGDHVHSYTEKVITAATCTGTGVISYTCSCGDGYTVNTEKTAHTPSKYVLMKTPTYSADGLKKQYCTVCNTELASITIPKIMPDIVSGSWYAEGAVYCITAGYISGNENGLFLPNGKLTREQFVVILARVAKAEPGPYENAQSGFSDIKAGQWYSSSVIWASKTGYVKGIGDGTRFGLGNNITRQELAVMFYRYAVAQGVGVNNKADLNKYTDSAKIASWAKNETAWAVNAGLLSSTDSSRMLLSPNMPVTRAQAAKIFMSYDEYAYKY